ncbi:hypothetical protein KM043_017011 [Ampulex compressa]|nr:hypothetical protein KM043_017011 [Ampulex compressa]
MTSVTLALLLLIPFFCSKVVVSERFIRNTNINKNTLFGYRRANILREDGSGSGDTKAIASRFGGETRRANFIDHDVRITNNVESLTEQPNRDTWDIPDEDDDIYDDYDSIESSEKTSNEEDLDHTEPQNIVHNANSNINSILFRRHAALGQQNYNTNENTNMAFLDPHKKPEGLQGRARSGRKHKFYEEYASRRVHKNPGFIVDGQELHEKPKAEEYSRRNMLSVQSVMGLPKNMQFANVRDDTALVIVCDCKPQGVDI